VEVGCFGSYGVVAMALTFVDANILFKMFAVSRKRLEGYHEKGTSGSKALDHAIDILLNLYRGGYSTSELALLEACGVVARVGNIDKATLFLRAVLEQEGFSILGVTALVYPLAYAFVLEYGIGARDALHLGVATISGVNRVATSDIEFADGVEKIGWGARSRGIKIPRIVEAMYGLSGQERHILENRATSALSKMETERAPP